MDFGTRARKQGHRPRAGPTKLHGHTKSRSSRHVIRAVSPVKQRRRGRASDPTDGVGLNQDREPLRTRGRVSDPLPVPKRAVHQHSRIPMPVRDRADDETSSSCSSGFQSDDDDDSELELQLNEPLGHAENGNFGMRRDDEHRHMNEADVAFKLRAIRDGPLVNGVSGQFQDAKTLFERASHNAKYFLLEHFGREYAEIMRISVSESQMKLEDHLHDLSESRGLLVEELERNKVRARKILSEMRDLLAATTAERKALANDTAELRTKLQENLSGLDATLRYDDRS